MTASRSSARPAERGVAAAPVGDLLQCGGGGFGVAAGRVSGRSVSGFRPVCRGSELLECFMMISSAEWAGDLTCWCRSVERGLTSVPPRATGRTQVLSPCKALALLASTCACFLAASSLVAACASCGLPGGWAWSGRAPVALAPKRVGNVMVRTFLRLW